MDKLLEKLKELGLEESVITDLKESYETSVNEKVEIKTALFITEKTTELEEKFEKEKEDYKKVKDEEMENSLKEMEENFVENLDTFIDTQIGESFDESILEEYAVNLACEPIVTAFRKVYEETFTELDSDATKIVKEAEEKVAAVTADLSEKITENMELHKKVSEIEKNALIAESTKDMSDEVKTKVTAYFKDKSLEECETDISKLVEVLNEAATVVETKEVIPAALITEDDKNEAPKVGKTDEEVQKEKWNKLFGSMIPSVK